MKLDTRVELEVINDLSGSQIDFNGIVHLDFGVWVADRSAIVSHDVGDLVGTHALSLHSHQLGLGLLGLDRLENETSCNISQQSEALSGLLNRHDV